MPFFIWKAEYSVGVQKLDDQHQQLVGLLNQLYEALEAGQGKEALGKILKSLMAYTKEHFLSEESLMKLYGYPGYLDHKAKHERMTVHVRTLAGQYAAGEISSPIQISNFLKDWLKKHILGTDMEYRPYLQGKGVR